MTTRMRSRGSLAVEKGDGTAMIVTSHRALKRAGLLLMLSALGLPVIAAWSSAAGARATAAKVGTPAAGFRDLDGRSHALLQPAELPAVYLFLATECPVSNVYTPRILALAKEYRGRGVRFFGIYSNAHERAPEIRRHAAERAYPFPIVRDDGRLAAGLGAKVTPEAVLLDRSGAVRYRGRIDDNRDPAQVTTHDLQAALDAVLAGRKVARAETPAFGCTILMGQTAGRADTAGKSASASKQQGPRVTYTQHVASILQQNCVVCHRRGEVAPFALETYPQAVVWAKAIKSYTASRKMPPWKADSHGEFHDERRLTQAEIATLGAWADAGAPYGDPRRLPPPPRFRAGWKLGQPDMIVEMPESYALAADGRDIYRCFVIPTDLAEDRWVSAIEVQAGNRAVVHHVLAFLDTSGAARKLDAADPGVGYTNPTPGNAPGFQPAGLLGVWAPGNEPRHLPAGVGNRLPKGADIVLEVHYHKNGKPESDRTRFGVYFAQGPIEKGLRRTAVFNLGLRIPADAASHEVPAGWTLPEDITLLDVFPHMHLIGRAMKAKAILPDGQEKLLVDVPDWDFNWQLTYTFKEPLKLPKGTRIAVTARYDNSAGNPNNPNKPPREMKWGEQTTDEMCALLLDYTRDAERLTAARPAPPGASP